jgi:predicted enzyme related to lactoylglutathione lyase
MKTNPVNWFEIPVTDMDRAKKFYEAVFDAKLSPVIKGSTKMFEFPTAIDHYGAAGMLVEYEHHKPCMDGVLIYFHVADIDETLHKVNANSGKTLQPKTAIGAFGCVAHFQDCEGNRLALHSMS